MNTTKVIAGHAPMKFIICAPRYEETSGGSIVLHKLAQILGALGHEVSLWPMHRIRLRPRPVPAPWWYRCTYAITRIYRPLYRTKPGQPVRLARTSDVDDSIVVYPETVAGNPLQAKRCVHWLLYRKEHLLDSGMLQPGDLYFCYQEAFNNPHKGLDYGGVLHVVDLMMDVYRNTHPGERSGACYMLRKGKSREDLPSLRGKLVVDGMSHQALAKIFNQTKYCYFYDPFTAYSWYAAACGCIPVVVPVPGMTREEWEPDGGRKPGIAYGEDDIPYAMESRDVLLRGMADAETKSIESVQRFVEITRAHFDWRALG
jgi:hypothetical protein